MVYGLSAKLATNNLIAVIKRHCQFFNLLIIRPDYVAFFENYVAFCKALIINRNYVAFYKSLNINPAYVAFNTTAQCSLFWKGRPAGY